LEAEGRGKVSQTIKSCLISSLVWKRLLLFYVGISMQNCPPLPSLTSCQLPLSDVPGREGGDCYSQENKLLVFLWRQGEESAYGCNHAALGRQWGRQRKRATL